VAVKRTIDDIICKLLELYGYEEDHRLGNVRLTIMALACAVALYAQIGPHSFPENKRLLTFSVGFYTICCALLQAMSVLIEKNFFVRTYDKEGLPGSAVMVTSELGRGEHKIEVVFHFRDSSNKHTETFTQSVGSYFSKDGEIDELELQRDVQLAMRRMEESLAASGSKKKN